MNPSLDPLQASHLNGRVVAVSYFDPACQVCHSWLRSVEETVDYLIADRAGMGGEDLLSLYVIGGPAANTGDPRPMARTYLNQHGLEHEAYWDRQRWLSQRVPDTRNATYVFDRDGRIIYRQSNISQAGRAAASRLEAAIARAL